jgi:iron complex outermembrane receptor protein
MHDIRHFALSRRSAHRRARRSGLGLRVIPAILSALVLLGGGTLAAQTNPHPQAPDGQDPIADLPLEDLLKLRVETVYAASRLAQEVTQAPASVTIISGEEIRQHGYRTLADVLRSVRGLHVSYDRNYQYVGVRGFARPGDYNTRILMLVDGHRLNDSVYDSAPLGAESPLDVGLIERVEIIRGPSSSVYGTSAFFAVVNVITRSGGSLDGVEAEGGTGMQDLWRGRVTAGGRTAGGVEGLLSVSGLRGGGAERLYYPEFDAPAEGDGVARGIDDDSLVTVFGSAAFRALTVQAGYGSRDKIVPTAPFETVFNDGGTHLRDARAFADVQFTRLLGDRATLVARAAHDRYLYDGSFVYEGGPQLDKARGAWTTTETGVVKWFARHRVSAGLEYRHNHQQDQMLEDETGVLLDDRRHSRTVAAYVEDEVRFHRRVLLTAGVRWDHYFETFGGTVNPRLALIVTPLDASVLKVLYGRAFRAPNPYELYYSRDPLSLSLNPERITTTEVVWEQQLDPRVQLTASAFVSRVSDLITQRSGSETAVDGLYYDNLGRVRARGVELELQGDLPGRVRARATWAYQSAVDRAASEGISNSPRHLGT